MSKLWHDSGVIDDEPSLWPGERDAINLSRCRADEAARITGLCVDGKPCGWPPELGDDRYCAECPNTPQGISEQEALSELALGFDWPGYADCFGQVMRKDLEAQGLEPDRFTGLNHLCREDWRERREEIWGDGMEHEKQMRYQDNQGDDWIDEFARTSTTEEFRGAMRFTIGKYNRRVGRKDEIVQEVRKMRDYCDRWIAYEEGRS